MASGVKIHDDCKREYNNIKMGHKYRYLIFRLNDDLTELVVETKAAVDAKYGDFETELKQAADRNECRFGLFDMAYEIKGVQKSKLVFVHWSPECAKIKQKMVYASSKQALVSELGTGIALRVQADDDGELAEDGIVKQLVENDRQ